jgi:hypothetical protein
VLVAARELFCRQIMLYEIDDGQPHPMPSYIVTSRILLSQCSAGGVGSRMVNEDVHCATNVVTVKVGSMSCFFNNAREFP